MRFNMFDFLLDDWHSRYRVWVAKECELVCEIKLTGRNADAMAEK